MALITPQSASGDSGASGPADGAATPGRGVPPAPRLARRAVLGTRRRKIVAGLVIAGAVAFLLVQGLANATEYYKTVPQAVAQRASLGTKQFRIMGEVGPTIERTATGYSFFITYDGVRADVVDTDQPSQLFKSGVPVVLEGHWAGTVFMSDLIMVKHSNNYTPPTDPAARSGSGAGS